jgi:hypothetical protein
MGIIMIIRMVATTIIMRMEMNRVMSIGTAGPSTMSTPMLVQMVFLRVVGRTAAGHRALSEAFVHHQALCGA